MNFAFWKIWSCSEGEKHIEALKSIYFNSSISFWFYFSSTSLSPECEFQGSDWEQKAAPWSRDFRIQHCELSRFLSRASWNVVLGFKAWAADIMILPSFSFKAGVFPGYYYSQNILDGKWKRKQFLRYKDFYKVSRFPEAWLTMSKIWSGQGWKRKLLCFTQETVSFHVAYREETGKDEASGGTRKPQNSLKCSERRLRNKVTCTLKNRKLGHFLFRHCSSRTNAFENSWASLLPYTHWVHCGERNVQSEKNPTRYTGIRKVLFKKGFSGA